MWDKSSGMINLGALPDGENYTRASAINDAGQVVGNSGDNAFAWSSNTGMIDLNASIDPKLGWYLQTATAINNKGQIIGYGTNQNGSTRAFVLTPKSAEPVPEPLTMGGTMLFGVGLAYLRRRQHQLLCFSKQKK